MQKFFVYFILIPLMVRPGYIAGYWLKIGHSTDPGKAAKRHYPTFEMLYQIPCKTKRQAKAIEDMLHIHLADERVNQERATSEVYYYTDKSINIVECLKKAKIAELTNEQLLTNAISDVLYPGVLQPLICRGINCTGYTFSKLRCIYGPSGKILDLGTRNDYQINIGKLKIFVDGKLQQKLIIKPDLTGVTI